MTNRSIAPALLLAALGPATTASAAPSPRTVVLELFQSQGCSSCPPALADLAAVADRPGVVALSFAVTYWDRLGWKDGFAAPAYTARQWDYAHRTGRAQVATPQWWIDGRPGFDGANRARLDAAIAAAPALPGPRVAIAGDAATVAAGPAPAGGADVWLVRYDPRTVPVAIRAGENGGRILPHRDIVRELVRLGRWTGPSARYPLPRAGRAGLRTAVLVQAGPGGPILSATAA